VSNTNNVIGAILKSEHDALVGILGRPLTQEPMRCRTTPNDEAPDIGDATDLERLMDSRRNR